MINTLCVLFMLVVFGGGWLAVGWFQSKLDITRIMREQDMTIRRMHDAPVIRCSPTCSGHLVLPCDGEKT